MAPKRLGIAIKRLRKQREMTQAALAERVGVHRIYIAQIEVATKTPSIATLEKIARALKVKVAELLK